MNSLPFTMFHQYHQGKTINKRKAGKMAFSGGAISSLMNILMTNHWGVVVGAVCVITARITVMADLV